MGSSWRERANLLRHSAALSRGSAVGYGRRGLLHVAERVNGGRNSAVFLLGGCFTTRALDGFHRSHHGYPDDGEYRLFHRVGDHIRSVRSASKRHTGLLSIFRFLRSPSPSAPRRCRTEFSGISIASRFRSTAGRLRIRSASSAARSQARDWRWTAPPAS